jgi:uroporphyrinogen III methyltransferase/synthase
MSDNDNNGIVYLIGAGPGDPGLITVKGMRLLLKSDVVIFDNLVPDELVATLPPQIEKYYVGKKAGRMCCSQEEINLLMVKHAGAGKKVARLKGSDPLIFGRGGEEAKYLKENNILYEIIPGVTSGVAAPAYCGIPCTDRNLASFVLFVTGHKALGETKRPVPWDWIAKAEGGTIVIYMGVGEIENIVRNLLDGGLDPDRPAAIIERGTYSTQKAVATTVVNLPGTVKRESIKPPALFVIGDVVNLKDWLNWFENKPLMGVRLMVTRAALRAQEIYENLRELGADVQPYPTIGIDAHQDNNGWKAFPEVKGKDKWLIFTSETGVNYFLKQFLDRIGDIRKLGDYKIAAVGESTARDLKRVGLKADFIPQRSTAADLAREIKENYDLKNASVVRIRGTLAADTIEKSIQDSGAKILPLTVYNTYYPKWPDGFVERLSEYPPDGIIFTSGSTVKGLFNNLPEKEVANLIKNCDIFSIGPSTTRTIEKHGLKITLEASPHNLKALTEQIVEYYQSKNKRRPE